VAKRLLATAAALAVSCGPAQYSFVAPDLPIANPASGAALGAGEAVAVDGLTKHRWISFSEAEACFDSKLNDLEPGELDPRRPFLLWGFDDQSEPIAKARAIASSRTIVKSSGQDDVTTVERRLALPHVEVEVCFARPGRVVTAATRWVVLRVPYSVGSEEIGSAGSRDGVWRLTKE